MTTKLCIDCKSIKRISKFYKQKDHFLGVMSYCKECFNKRCNLRWINRKIKYMNLLGGECQDCNLKLINSHYSVFEFHHLFSHKKDYDWSKMRLQSDDKIKKELSKCILLCANCHRIRHAKFRALEFPEQLESQ